MLGGNSLDHRPYGGGPENFNRLFVYRVECDWKSEPLHYFFDRGSSTFHWYLVIVFETVPVTRIAVEKVDEQGRILVKGYVDGHDRYGRWVIQFKGRGGPGLYQ
jgi:hypothetical protein